MTPLDAWRQPSRDVRIVVDAWLAVRPLSGQYITRSPDLRTIWNYVRHIGALAAARKVRSRVAERKRNRKWAGIGAGTVVGSPPGSELRAGTRVVFFAPNHSIEWPRICLDQALVCAAAEGAQAPDDLTPELDAETALTALEDLAGWSPFSGVPLDRATVRSTLRALQRMPGHSVTPVMQRRCHAVCERRGRTASATGRPSAVLFGFGNYAKTQIIPCIGRHLSLAAIHEIDPDQLAAAAGFAASLDTSPHPRSGDRYDAWFIAGFHHTHAKLAAHALRSGAYAVVEKPLATTRDQLAVLDAAARRMPRRKLFTCFQRRYAEFNAWARHDLGVATGDPVDMHCLVYEIPLPALHWYNWPNSRSRLVSNGCHWLDYFLFMNDYSPVSDRFVRAMRGSDVLVHVRLDNGAQLSLSITDSGSDRLGVRDVIDMRAARNTVRVVDAAWYEAESHSRVVRRVHVNPINSYRRMYESMCRAIAANEPADRLETLRSTDLMLDLDEELNHVPRFMPTARKSPAAPPASPAPS
jgi:predicted dehydrogenase